MYQEHVETPAVVEQKSLKRRWVEALRSGRYKQAFGTIRAGTKFCALGVLADVIDHEAWEGSMWLGGFTGSVVNAVSDTFMCDSLQRVYELNDDKRRSFHAIADWVERNVKEL